jgi:hypothetical protein
MGTHHKPQEQGLAFWQPDLGWWTSANSRLHTSFVARSDEWQAFVGHRVREDLNLWQELAGAKTPDAIWSAYAEFWQKAVEDYWKEYATFCKFSGTLVADIAAGQPACEGAPPLARAA